MLDNVQFPRRGWVHRNVFTLSSGGQSWLTLPLRKTGRETLIRDVSFTPDAQERLKTSSRRFPVLERAMRDETELMQRVMRIGAGNMADYLCALAESIRADLGFDTPMLRSSSLAVAPELHGQARVLAIVEYLGGTRYVNPPGGRALYDARAFAERGVELRFLTPYDASHASILTRLLEEQAKRVSREINAQSTFLQ